MRPKKRVLRNELGWGLVLLEKREEKGADADG
jgi:hypothetical protein